MRQHQGSSRWRLRAAAKTLFAQRGYEATAISDVTRAAGTSHSQFLKYYSGKGELRREIIDEEWTELRKAIVLASISVQSPAEKLRLSFNMFISFLESDPQFRAILLLEQIAVRERGVAVTSQAFREFVAVLDDILGGMKDAGQLREDIDAQVFRSALLGAVQGAMRDQMLTADDFPALYSVEQVRSMLSLMIDSACELQPRSVETRARNASESEVVSEDKWIRYYLKLADKALHPSELS